MTIRLRGAVFDDTQWRLIGTADVELDRMDT